MNVAGCHGDDPGMAGDGRTSYDSLIACCGDHDDTVRGSVVECFLEDPLTSRRRLNESRTQVDDTRTCVDAFDNSFGQFYGTVLRDAPMTLTPEYASAIVRRFFDARGPLAPYSDVPREYVIMQRINLGLYAVLGSLHATANWRRIAEEIWPFRNGPPSTPIGEAEARWEAARGRVRSGASALPQ